VVLQTVIAAHLADERVTAKSHRIGFSLPGSHGHYYDGIGPALTVRREIPGLVEKIAKPALPRRMRERLAGREAERREAERQEDVVGRDADGVEATRGEVVAAGEPLTEKAKRAFEETAGPVEWSAEDELWSRPRGSPFRLIRPGPWPGWQSRPRHGPGRHPSSSAPTGTTTRASGSPSRKW
jgi:hypothetical protein